VTHPALRGIPTDQRVVPVASGLLLVWKCRAKPRSSLGNHSTLGGGRCPVDLVRHARYARYNVAGGDFPVGLSSLPLRTMYFLSQAQPLGGLHRASPVPFRGSYCTPRVPPLDATPQRLTACWYRPGSFPLIPSPRFVAHGIVVSPHEVGYRNPSRRRCHRPHNALLKGIN
jgi:hypothetical protein